MRPLWKGSLSFGLVNIPVRLYAATENKGISFRYLHSSCHTPLEYRKICPSCNKEVPWEEIVRGYEYEQGHFVILNQEEIASATGEKERIIEILDFVKIQEIDPLYFQKGYYLAPDGPGKKPYALLREAMQETEMIAMATVVLRAKELPAVVRVYREVLSLSTMFYPDEVRLVQDIPDIPREEKVSEKELSMARELIGNLEAPFEPSKYRDKYRAKILEIIEAKVKGKEVAVAPSPEREKVVDLMEALEASVEKTKQQKENGKKKGRKKTVSRA